MLINSVIELAIISIISKDRQEISRSQWLALPQGWGWQSESLVALKCQKCECICQSGSRGPGLLHSNCSALWNRGVRLGKRGPCLPWLPSGGNRKAPKCLAFPKGKQSLQVPAALEEKVAGSRSLHARRHWDCSAFERCYLITLLHNDITCVFPLLIHFCQL